MEDDIFENIKPTSKRRRSKKQSANTNNRSKKVPRKRNGNFEKNLFYCHRDHFHLQLSEEKGIDVQLYFPFGMHYFSLNLVDCYTMLELQHLIKSELCIPLQYQLLKLNQPLYKNFNNIPINPKDIFHPDLTLFQLEEKISKLGLSPFVASDNRRTLLLHIEHMTIMAENVPLDFYHFDTVMVPARSNFDTASVPISYHYYPVRFSNRNNSDQLAPMLRLDNPLPVFSSFGSNQNYISNIPVDLTSYSEEEKEFYINQKRLDAVKRRCSSTQQHLKEIEDEILQLQRTKQELQVQLERDYSVIMDSIFQAFPSELYIRIFSFLNPFDLSQAAQVSTRWYKYACTNDLWKELYLYFFVPISPVEVSHNRRVSHALGFNVLLSPKFKVPLFSALDFQFLHNICYRKLFFSRIITYFTSPCKEESIKIGFKQLPKDIQDNITWHISKYHQLGQKWAKTKLPLHYRGTIHPTREYIVIGCQLSGTVTINLRAGTWAQHVSPGLKVDSELIVPTTILPHEFTLVPDSCLKALRRALYIIRWEWNCWTLHSTHKRELFSPPPSH